MTTTRPTRRLPSLTRTIALCALAAFVAACATRTPAPIVDRTTTAPALPAPSPAPPVIAPSATPAPLPVPAAPPPTYVVKRGDTLRQIANEVGVETRDLAAWNNIENVNVIRVGQALRLTPPGSESAATATPPPPGTTGIRLLAGAGLLGPTTMAAHCVDVEADEIALLAQAGTGVAHCPRSNGYLGCGVAPLEELLAAGIPVGIATDSPASTPSFDLFEEARTAMVAARARAGRPDALSAARALELATMGGARVLGMDGEVGSLVPGKQADLFVVSLEDSPFAPVEDPVVSLVLGGSPERVAATLVAGEDRYRRGTTAWPDSRRAARRARSRMLQ